MQSRPCVRRSVRNLSGLVALASFLAVPGFAQVAQTEDLDQAPVALECFPGTGGPDGTFDWVVRDGDRFFFDTTLTQIVGGPNGLPIHVQNCVDGVVEVRNLIIEEGGEIRVQGPNPIRINATGDVIVRGKLELSGFPGRDVATLNTGNQIEMGGAGSAGGGRGGLGNPITTASSPRGGAGQGAFGLANAGGQGGESAYAPIALGKDARRPGGGGGGRFARNQGPGLAASSGFDGHELGNGAESGLSPARGGVPGSGPFLDADARNDFFGVRPVGGGSVTGELLAPWAGAGGGGGGNAVPSRTFPNPNWNFASDEKGGGGGGGGGALHVRALGPIVFGAAAELRCNGARGGTGENTVFLDHVGGTGGSGSGGHVVLESATLIDFTDGGSNMSALPRDWISAAGGPLWRGQPTSGGEVSFGGSGGPGVIQLHVPRPKRPPGTDPALTDILVPPVVAQLRNPLAAIASPGALAAFLTFEDCAGLQADAQALSRSEPALR